MKQLRLLLIVGNAAVVILLLMVPAGKLVGALERGFTDTAFIGWLLHTVVGLASLSALWGVQFSHARLVRPFVATAVVGSVMLMMVSAIFARSFYLVGRPDIAPIAIAVMMLLGLNVLALWTPFRTRKARTS
jgi:hypothetical protein